MTEEETKTPEASGDDDVASSEQAPAKSTSDGDAAKTAEPGKETSAEPKTEKSEYRYVGKKFKDVNDLEEGYNNLERKLTEQGTEKNEALEKAKIIDGLSEKTGLSTIQITDYLKSQLTPKEQARDEVSSQPSQQNDELRATRIKLAQVQEDFEMKKLFDEKPHLRDVEDEIRASWRFTNKPLDEVADRFEGLVAKGRNENREDMLRKQQQKVETGKGAGEPESSETAQKREEAMTRLKKNPRPKIDDILAAMPKIPDAD